MARVTFYLDDETEARMKAAVRASRLSQNQWIADAVRLRVRAEWPASVAALAGAWSDLPTAEQLRLKQKPDVVRVRL